jgi:hypothetical protein
MLFIEHVELNSPRVIGFYIFNIRLKRRGYSLLPRAKQKMKDERSFLENSRSRRIAQGNSLNYHGFLNCHGYMNYHGFQSVVTKLQRILWASALTDQQK